MPCTHTPPDRLPTIRRVRSVIRQRREYHVALQRLFVALHAAQNAADELFDLDPAGYPQDREFLPLCIASYSSWDGIDEDAGFVLTLLHKAEEMLEAWGIVTADNDEDEDFGDDELDLRARQALHAYRGRLRREPFSDYRNTHRGCTCRACRAEARELATAGPVNA